MFLNIFCYMYDVYLLMIDMLLFTYVSVDADIDDKQVVYFGLKKI